MGGDRRRGESAALLVVYCLDAGTGKVIWIFCTNQYLTGVDNLVNVLPAAMCLPTVDPPFQIASNTPVTLAARSGLRRPTIPSSTSSIAPPATRCPTGSSPARATRSGCWRSRDRPATSWPSRSFRRSRPTVRPTWTSTSAARHPLHDQRRKVVGLGCKNGSYMVCDAQTLEIITWRQMLPYMNDGAQIATAIRTASTTSSTWAPSTPTSNRTRFHRPRSRTTIPARTTTAPTARRHLLVAAEALIGLGATTTTGSAPGSIRSSTPFMRAMNWETLDDAWPMDNSNPRKYSKASAAMYQNAGESGISVPAVVNDVVFMATTQIALYAFSATDGTLLWNDMVNFGSETEGFMGGYGYCMGTAIWGNYVVAGGLGQGRAAGGVLNVYKLG